MSKTIKMLLLVIFYFSIFFCFPSLLSAAANPETGLTAPKLQITIPTVHFGTDKDKWIGEYIKGVYEYGLKAVGILAAVVLMWGGLVWLTAGGNTSRVDDAKKWIIASLSGLVIALTSYVLLFTINPSLVIFKDIGVEPVKNITGYGGGTEGTNAGGTSPSKVQGKIADQGLGKEEIEKMLSNIIRDSGYPNNVTYNSKPPALPKPNFGNLMVASAAFQELHNAIRININDPISIDRSPLERYKLDSLINELNLDNADPPPNELTPFTSPYNPDTIEPPDDTPLSIYHMAVIIAGIQGMVEALPDDPAQINRQEVTLFDYNEYFRSIAEDMYKPDAELDPRNPPDIPNKVGPPQQIPSMPDLGLAVALLGEIDDVNTSIDDLSAITREEVTGFDYADRFQQYPYIMENIMPPDSSPQMPPNTPFKLPKMPTIPDLQDVASLLRDMFNNMNPGPEDPIDFDYDKYTTIAAPPEPGEYLSADYIDYATKEPYFFPTDSPPPGYNFYSNNETSSNPSLNITSLPNKPDEHEGTFRYRNRQDVGRILHIIRDSFPDYRIITRTYGANDPNKPQPDKHGLITEYIRLVPKD